MPVTIPELKKVHVALMQDLLALCSPRIAWVQPDRDKDSPESYARYVDTNMAIDDLVALGMLNDITNDDGSRPFLDALADSGRSFRIFETTKIGAIMMKQYNDENKWIN